MTRLLTLALFATLLLTGVGCAHNVAGQPVTLPPVAGQSL